MGHPESLLEFISEYKKIICDIYFSYIQSMHHYYQTGSLQCVIDFLRGFLLTFGQGKLLVCMTIALTCWAIARRATLSLPASKKIKTRK